MLGTKSKTFALAMYISCLLCRFHLHLVPNTNPISSGIWALIFHVLPDGFYCVGHVHFIFFVQISFAFGGQCKASIQWNMGFSFCFMGSRDYNYLFLGMKPRLDV